LGQETATLDAQLQSLFSKKWMHTPEGASQRAYDLDIAMQQVKTTMQTLQAQKDQSGQLRQQGHSEEDVYAYKQKLDYAFSTYNSYVNQIQQHLEQVKSVQAQFQNQIAPHSNDASQEKALELPPPQVTGQLDLSSPGEGALGLAQQSLSEPLVNVGGEPSRAEQQQLPQNHQEVAQGGAMPEVNSEQIQQVGEPILEQGAGGDLDSLAPLKVDGSVKAGPTAAQLASELASELAASQSQSQLGDSIAGPESGELQDSTITEETSAAEATNGVIGAVGNGDITEQHPLEEKVGMQNSGAHPEDALAVEGNGDSTPGLENKLKRKQPEVTNPRKTYGGLGGISAKKQKIEHEMGIMEDAQKGLQS